jgi:pSer/pThr/pTyr-binding forkhead associated (FHA) protein
MSDEKSKGEEPTVVGGVPVVMVQKRSKPFCLRQVKGPGAPRDCLLELQEVVIGRAQEAQLSLDSGAVSRRHARLVRTGSSYRVEDLESANGVYVNGERTTAAELADGDSLQVGDAVFVYQQGR